MNNSYINRLVELISSPIITPYNLVEFLKLKNYKSLNFIKKNNNVIAKITFTSYENIENNLYYVFNFDNELIEIYQIYNGKKIVCFNREKEKNQIIDELNASYNTNIKDAIY